MPDVKPARILALERAHRYVGVKEDPPGSNSGPRSGPFKGKIDQWCRWANGLTHYPWCAAFVCGMYRELGYEIPEPRRASVGFLEAWASKVGALVERPFRGDLVCYRFDSDNWPDHIGFVDRVLAVRWAGGSFVGTIRTVEGNTARGDDANGGQVQIRYRSARRCKFIRLSDDLLD